MMTDSWNTQIMRNFERTKSIKLGRKLLKPQVERKRRERMNHSLENLKILLLQGPEHKMASQRRVEKAEILEHTVLFLQTSMAQDKKTQQDGGTEGQRFLDGFSTCLQRATRFLQEGEARGLQGSLSNTLYQCLSHPNMPIPIPVSVEIDVSTCTKVLDSNRRKQNQKAGYTHGLRQNLHPYRMALRHEDPNAFHHPINTVITSPNNLSGPQAPIKQCVWRPWL